MTTQHEDRPLGRLPTGTVTFLRTDVEGSMRLARALGPQWDDVNAIHLGIIRAAVDARGGVVVRTEGDALFAVFAEARAATDAGGGRAARDRGAAVAARGPRGGADGPALGGGAPGR